MSHLKILKPPNYETTVNDAYVCFSSLIISIGYFISVAPGSDRNRRHISSFIVTVENIERVHIE